MKKPTHLIVWEARLPARTVEQAAEIAVAALSTESRQVFKVFRLPKDGTPGARGSIVTAGKNIPGKRH